MIDFSKYRRIKIPEGMVKTIKRKSDGLILWIAKYLNIIPKATTTPGGAEIYNGIGYKDGTRWSSSGGALVVGSGNERVTGWMKHEAGKTYRAKCFGLSTGGYVDGAYIVFAKADGSTIHTVTTGTNTSNKQHTTTSHVDLTQDLLTFVNTDTNAKYFRISGYCAATPSTVNSTYVGDPIITCDEEIIE